MKRRDNKGFTLIEMLIVVGIIAILVAVSIPVVNSSLEKARIATDAANERAAKAAAMTMYLTGELDDFFKNTSNGPYYSIPYDAVSGTLMLKESKDEVSTIPEVGYGKCKKHKDGYIVVNFEPTEDFKLYVKWHGRGFVRDGHGIDLDD